jgi:MerR family transcriptional regulator/heat shock protein HspR
VAAKRNDETGTPDGRAGRRAEDRRKKFFESDRGVFMISVAAELAGMHPQTLRVYEARGLIKPSRSPKRTRLYSQEDVERLRRIQELTSELGLNLAGVERVLELEQAMTELRGQFEELRRESERLRKRMFQEIEAVHRSYKRELVPWQPPGEMLAIKHARPFKIQIQKTQES